MKHGLVFAAGPTPAGPETARQLGWYECWIGRALEDNAGRFFKYIPLAALPEVIAYVRAVGRDCEYRVFNERHALLAVEAVAS